MNQNQNLLYVLKELEREKGISEAALLEAITGALALACKKQLGLGAEVDVEYNPANAQFRVFAEKQVVARVTDPSMELALEPAREIDPSVEVGQTVRFEVTPKDFGRIAAQTAKQVVLQRIREAERDAIYDELADKEGEIVNGQVQRAEGRNVYVDVGRIEAILPPNEQPVGERYRAGDRMKFYVLHVRKTSKGPEMVLSRSHPNLIRRLFELEAPEVEEGLVELKAIAREAGQRSKVAVYSNDSHVDAVGACVGARGSRVQAVTDELGNEKLDIVRWSEDPAEFVRESLKPADVKRVIIDEENHAALVLADDSQLSLAIGRQGQNVRLAAKVTGWRIDIRSTTPQPEAELEDKGEPTEEGEQSSVEPEIPEAAEQAEE